ncbi:MAG: Asp-tRNA(Asn)/Glu-tRNA(Gln) amidotransferase subunit GatA [Pseudomonadota bacterium]|nr:Asp-tRNA(Asn)/Glu-tRNA(Gln) amidotransferase subunit GatA [Pseudomonadota bacterium]
MSTQTPILEMSLTELVDGIHQGNLQADVVSQTYIDQALTAKENNSFLCYSDTADLAKVSLEHKDKPLAGLPIAHKDLFCTQALPTTCGSKMLAGFMSPFDADIVESTAEAGAVLLGKTNMDEFAMGSASENPHFGPVLNPWNHGYVAGGSSGGSAAAVAARMTPLATASDTGGSIRQPAAFCGVTGFKPTYGSISRWGMVAYASSFDQAGPIAKTALDCSYYFDIVNRPDEKDTTCYSAARKATYPALQAISENADNALKFDQLTIGYLPTWLAHEGLDAGVRESFEKTKAEFEAKGAKFVALELPSLHYALAAYYILAPAEASSNLSRFDGVRFGHQCENPQSLEDLYKRSRQEGFGFEVKRRILTGTFVLSEGFFDAYYKQAQKIRRLIKNDFDKAFKQVDLILTPTTPTTAFPLGSAQRDPVEIYLQDVFTIPANLAGLPAISFPSAPAKGMPVGMQFMGQCFDDEKVLAATHLYQTITDWHKASPLAQTSEA